MSDEKQLNISRPVGSEGGKARASKLTPTERSAIARAGATARWSGKRTIKLGVDGLDAESTDAENESQEPTTSVESLPEAKHRGVLRVLEIEIPCYVLSDGQRVIGRTSVTEMLTGQKGMGNLEHRLRVAALRPYIDLDSIVSRMVQFRLPEVEGLNRASKGLPADLLIELCQGFVRALEAATQSNGPTLTSRQIDMALKASMFLSACAKVGLDAMIDEATGYQYERAADALQVKLAAYLETEMRKWEKTFPDELWEQFGRLTGWSKSVTKRPKYWGQLVMDLVYDYLDHDVAKWLKDNAPAPSKGKNYHQWLSGQYGLRKLTEHIWKLIGVAQTCKDIGELKKRMAELHGRIPIQYVLYIPADSDQN